MNQLGYYGKTPQRGDFVRFNLPAAFVKVWDDWLQQLMLNGETTYTTRWSDLYHAAPAYRFGLSCGIAGESVWLGVVMPGQDKVGRRFPFCLALSLPADENLMIAMQQHQAWYEDAEKLVLKLLADEAEFDSLQAQMQDMLEQHNVKSTCAMLNAVPPLTDNSVALLVNHRQALSQHAACLSVLNASLSQTLGYFSIWQACDNADHCLLTSGLPDERCALALFSQQWTEAQVSQLDVSGLMAIGSAMNVHQAVSPDNENAALATHSSSTEPYHDTLKSDTQPDENGSPHVLEPFEDGASTASENINPVESSTAPSADDWAALDEFRSTEPETPVLPEAEKLELDEDDSSTAPWES